MNKKTNWNKKKKTITLTKLPPQMDRLYPLVTPISKIIPLSSDNIRPFSSDEDDNIRPFPSGENLVQEAIFAQERAQEAREDAEITAVAEGE